MTICDYKHDEIVFEGKVCPLCEAENRISDLELKIKALSEEIESIEC